MEEKKKVRASLETPAYLFVMPFLALCAFAMVYDAIKHGGQLFAGFYQSWQGYTV